jgi:hypothetical protein
MKLQVREISLFERDVKLRMPFRFGVVTLTEAPQAFVRARVRLENGKEAEGGAAELLVPKWFDKDPALTNEQNFEQLRASLRLAREAYLGGGVNTAFGHSIEIYGPQIAIGATQGLNSLVACYGPALIDRAVLDALCRALGVSFYAAIQKNLPGISAPGWQADLLAFDMDEFLAGLKPRSAIAARHTVGLADPLTAAEKKLSDGLPETLEEVVERYRHRWFKLKISGDMRADLDRLTAIAKVLDARIGDPYRATLDGNEQFSDAEAVVRSWKAIQEQPELRRLASSVVYIEQPITRSRALGGDISALA